MLQLRHFEDQRCKKWCAAVVLVAAWSLTVSLATRYSTPWDASAPTVKVVQTHTSPEAKRQRLAKDAFDWAPPVVCFSILLAPSSYPRVSPAGPPMPSLLFEESLYDRPPPSSEILS
jgi:hypothetical protein